MKRKRIVFSIKFNHNNGVFFSLLAFQDVLTRSMLFSLCTLLSSMSLTINIPFISYRFPFALLFMASSSIGHAVSVHWGYIFLSLESFQAWQRGNVNKKENFFKIFPQKKNINGKFAYQKQHLTDIGRVLVNILIREKKICYILIPTSVGNNNWGSRVFHITFNII